MSALNYQYLVGMTFEEASDALKNAKVRYRISVRDGQHMMLTEDLDPTRVNLKLTADVVSEVTMG